MRDARAIVPHPLFELLAATVAIARGAHGEAEHRIDAGLAMMADQNDTGRYAAVGLDLVKGLLLRARGADETDVRKALERETARAASGHLFAREYAAHAHYALGAVFWCEGDATAARPEFARALTLAPNHALARAGLAVLDGGADASGIGAAPAHRDLAADGRSGLPSPDVAFATAMAQAAIQSARGDAESAARPLYQALCAAPPGSTGWMTPIDPLLDVRKNQASWARFLAMLRSRAL